jgi:pimeloyl-ACP methyl ester carboxylesterase
VSKLLFVLLIVSFTHVLIEAQQTAVAQSATVDTPLPALGPDRTISAADCALGKLGMLVPASAIGEPVSAVTLSAPRWIPATDAVPAYCSVDGVMTPVDTGVSAKPINFRVVLPSSWNHRAAQFGGGGMNGTIPNLAGSVGAAVGATPLQRGFATYGSDSGHQGGFGRGGGAPSPSNDWATNDEAMKNLGYMQMKKTHDAAMVVIERAYGERPRFNYYFGTSQGGREALTVAQRYPADYDGILANVPIVSFSSLMLAPEIIRIQEKPLANWITSSKVNAIRGEFIRQCDGLDGLADGIINNYMACRAVFDISQGTPDRHPWTAKRCPGNVDSNPADTTSAACLTDGQISTLELVYSRYRFATPLANGVRTFGMWLPNTEPSGSGLILDTRFKGQEGAGPDAPGHSHLGVLGVTGFLMRDVGANPLDYVEGGPLDSRRVEISRYLDATNPDLSAFQRRGGKMIVTIGTNDTLASPGAQLDYFQTVIDKMGRQAVDTFARFFVIPQAGHGLTGTSHTVAGDGQTIASTPIPNRVDRLVPLIEWVERKVPPGKTLTVTAGDRSLPLCSYPAYPKYTSGPINLATSYTCAS